VVDGAGAASWKGAGVASDEGEGAIGMADGEVLRADLSDAVEVGEVVNDEVAHFSGWEEVAGFGIKDELTAPVREAVSAIWPRGVGLAGELGHAVFVVNVSGGN